MPDIENDDFDLDSAPDSPINQSEKRQSEERPLELEEWEATVKKSVSFRHTFHEKLDHLKLKEWLQTTFKAGVAAPEKGTRNGKLHYQCYILHVDKKEFTTKFDEYKKKHKYNEWTYLNVDGESKPFNGNKLQCVQDTKDLHQLAKYCVKENKTLTEVLHWGIPDHIIELYASLSKLKHDTKEILDRQEKLDEAFLLGSINDEDYLSEWIQIYHDYAKDFKLSKIKDHYITLRSKKDPKYKLRLIKDMITTS